MMLLFGLLLAPLCLLLVWAGVALAWNSLGGGLIYCLGAGLAGLVWLFVQAEWRHRRARKTADVS